MLLLGQGMRYVRCLKRGSNVSLSQHSRRINTNHYLAETSVSSPYSTLLVISSSLIRLFRVIMYFTTFVTLAAAALVANAAAIFERQPSQSQNHTVVVGSLNGTLTFNPTSVVSIPHTVPALQLSPLRSMPLSVT